MEPIWSEQLSVGNETIDLDHKVLFGLMNGVVHAMKSRSCSVLLQAFELLDDRLRTHFHNEECIAEVVNFPFAQNKEAHQFLLRELEYLKNELLGKHGVCCEAAISHCSDSLRGLLIEHITSRDMLMKPVLKDYPYNLTPVRQVCGSNQK